MNYQSKKQRFLKIHVSHPKFVAPLRTLIERGKKIAGKDLLSKTTFESNVPFPLRFMIDNEIGGMTWIRVEQGKWKMRDEKKKETRC